MLDFSINKQRFMTAQLDANGPKEAEIEEEKIEVKQEKKEEP